LNRIRVAVADDSAFLRQAVARMLEGQEGVVLAGVAASGEELLDHLERWRADVIILDLSMPGLGGLATLDAVMARRPTPVLILSTHSRQDAPQTIEALHRGALDFVDKQQYSLVDFERLRAVLLDKIRQLARRPAARPPAGQEAQPAAPLAAVGAPPMPPAAPVPPTPPAAGARAPETVGARAIETAGARAAAGGAPELVLLGASTGGPPAVETILRQLGGRPPAPVVVAQHMPAGFTRSFAQRLNACLPLPVREAVDGEALDAGTVYVAPGGVHLRLVRAREGLRATLSPYPEESAHHPSIDLLFVSAVAAVGERAVAVVLTGMGHDGAAGMAALARAGAHTIAQDEATSAVYGMPRAALATGGVLEVLPLEAIAGRLRQLLGMVGVEGLERVDAG
jgi:two-component system chemotaxis response regulator CheB